MLEHVYKTIELVGSSADGYGGRRAERGHQGIANAAELRWFEVVETRGHIEGGRVAHLAGDSQDWALPLKATPSQRNSHNPV
jgi:flavin-binding protein dodecin